MRCVVGRKPTSWTAASVADIRSPVPPWPVSSNAKKFAEFTRKDHGSIPRQSKQLHVDQRPGFDDLELSRDLDIAVRLRHARDVAGCLERRYGRSVLDSHRVELVAAGHRAHARGHGKPDRP